MLIAHVFFFVDETMRQRVVERLGRDVGAVKAMNGCFAFIPFMNNANPQEVGILHEWKSAEDFAGYTSSDMFARFQEELRPMMVAPPISRRFEAELVSIVR